MCSGGKRLRFMCILHAMACVFGLRYHGLFICSYILLQPTHRASMCKVPSSLLSHAGGLWSKSLTFGRFESFNLAPAPVVRLRSLPSGEGLLCGLGQTEGLEFTFQVCRPDPATEILLQPAWTERWPKLCSSSRAISAKSRSTR